MKKSGTATTQDGEVVGRSVVLEVVTGTVVGGKVLEVDGGKVVGGTVLELVVVVLVEVVVIGTFVAEVEVVERIDVEGADVADVVVCSGVVAEELVCVAEELVCVDTVEGDCVVPDVIVVVESPCVEVVVSQGLHGSQQNPQQTS